MIAALKIVMIITLIILFTCVVYIIYQLIFVDIMNVSVKPFIGEAICILILGTIRFIFAILNK